MLRDRFGLVLRVETRELPIYVLRQAKTGSRLSPHAEGTPGMIQTHAGYIVAGDASIDILAKLLSGEFRCPVHDETGLTGQYDFKLDWTPDADAFPDAAPAGLSSPATGASIFTAITEQLGLRLERKRHPCRSTWWRRSPGQRRTDMERPGSPRLAPRGAVWSKRANGFGRRTERPHAVAVVDAQAGASALRFVGQMPTSLSAKHLLNGAHMIHTGLEWIPTAVDRRDWRA